MDTRTDSISKPFYVVITNGGTERYDSYTDALVERCRLAAHSIESIVGDYRGFEVYSVHMDSNGTMRCVYGHSSSVGAWYLRGSSR